MIADTIFLWFARVSTCAGRCWGSRFGTGCRVGAPWTGAAPDGLGDPLLFRLSKSASIFVVRSVAYAQPVDSFTWAMQAERRAS